MSKLALLASVTAHREIGDAVWLMDFSAPEMAAQAQPGQFVHLCLPNQDQPFLRRPLSLANVDKKAGTLTVIYRIIGEGTRRFAALKVGDKVDVMGPLGTGFRLMGERPLLIGGGMGVAPLIYLAEAFHGKPVEVLLGGRNKAEMFWPDYFAKSGAKIHITTDDGSVGTKGFTAALLPKLLNEGKHDVLFACGPQPMMAGVAKMAKETGVACQVSLEAHMACGLGACLSCTCEGTDGHRRKICTDGPVFDAKEVFA